MTTKNRATVVFGTYLRKVRETKSIFSQEALATKAGLHRNFIGILERGEQNPSLLTIAKLAKALEISLADFFAGMPEIPLE